MDYSEEVKAKLTALRALPEKERRPAEVVAYYWGAPDGTTLHAIAPYDGMPGYGGLPAALAAAFGPGAEVDHSIISDPRSPFTSLPRTASISDDSVEHEHADFDGTLSGLMMRHGEGTRCEVFGYWEGVGLLLSQWRGALRAPKEMRRDRIKLAAAAGFRSMQMLLPRRLPAVSCLFTFGGHLRSQAEIDYHQGCPFNAQLTEEERGGAPLVGLNDPDTGLPWTHCTRRDSGVCLAHLGTKRFWPGFETRPDPVFNGQTKGPNLLARAYGNDSALSDPIRVIAGVRLVRSLTLLAYRNETNTKHPDKGFGAGLFVVSEGPNSALWDFRMNNVYVAAMHSNLRLGELGQAPTSFSPNVGTFSGTSVGFGRIQGNFNDNQAASLAASIMCQGLRDLRVYADAETYVEQFSQNRMVWLLRMLCDPRWGYGNDYSRYNLDSAVETAEWCDEAVAMRAPDGEVFSGTRSTFNAELVGRTTQQQITDLCVAGRIGLPFEFDGLDVFVPLRKEDTSDPDIPAFTDEGEDSNIVHERGRSSLVWSQQSDSELVNQWTVNLDDASNGHVDTQLIFGSQGQQLRAGRAWGDRSIRVVNKSQPAFGITNYSEAARLGVMLLYLGPLDAGGIANNFEVKFTTWWSDALRVRNYKLIRVLNARLRQLILAYFDRLAASNPEEFAHYAGLPYEYFRVKKVVRKGDLKVEITAQLYPEDFYEAVEGEGAEPPDLGGVPLPNPGGRPDDQPERILPIDIAHDGDRIVGRFAESAF
jgi:hypothetical protein